MPKTHRNEVAPAVDRVVRPAEACKILSVSRSSLWRYSRNCPDFPRHRQLGPRSVGWMLSELMEFLEGRRVAA